MNFLAIFFYHSSGKNVKLKPLSYDKAFNVSMRTMWREYVVTKEREPEFRKNDIDHKSFGV